MACKSRSYTALTPFKSVVSVLIAWSKFEMFAMRPWKSWKQFCHRWKPVKNSTFLKSLWLLNLSSHHVWNHSESPASAREARRIKVDRRELAKKCSAKNAGSQALGWRESNKTQHAWAQHECGTSNETHSKNPETIANQNQYLACKSDSAS